MHRSASILLYGQDVDLLRIRSMVLSRGDDMVSFTTKEELAREMLDVCEIDLLILCHTLPVQHCDSLIAEAEWAWPDTKVLVLHGARNTCGESDDVATLEALCGPTALVEKVDQLLDTMVH